MYASPVLLGDAYRQRYENMIVVSPDVGGVVRARALAKRLDDADLAIIDKRRPRPNESKVMNIIGDVEGQAPACSSTTWWIPRARWQRARRR